MKNTKLSTFLTLLLVAFALFGCKEAPQESMVHQAAAIESGDECHLCGMIITNFPGPKGELYTKTSDMTKKFCSTRDLFSFILDPEYQHQVKEIYVHDMSKTPWTEPKDSYFIDARKAWYVLESSRSGAMGKTLASFVNESDAQAFMLEFGGKIYQFDEITMAML
ncbi:nitrous oxide reductase accessory protein NosL [Shewanella sp. KX20019]|uniref:nitrous oxide reductase accessory protein NosL n=1 Tax=Shewanella sp. KX20019 TaxID=2803864 RepID=UPI001925DECA|nr:nitrous oxide reductase accessory protein NosL [Shewanella sp. KX20019]QQX82035.1 nitrous oxide reductase accessory protein NosL [Shewanella sp. KX20019]